MTTEQKIRALCDIVIKEMRVNPAFKKQVNLVMSEQTIKTGSKSQRKRNPSLINPYELMRLGREELETALEIMTVDQLKDIVLEHDMDSAKLAMKWKSKDKLVALIVETAERRVTKGNVFLLP